jgi:hypothetical protein
MRQSSEKSVTNYQSTMQKTQKNQDLIYDSAGPWIHAFYIN